MKILLVFNPHAHSGRSVKKLPAIREALLANSLDADIVFSGERGHAINQVAETSLDNYDGVVAAGGDGTVFEVLNGLYQHERSQRVPLGLIPMGTGNAFAREFELFPSNWIKAVELIARGRIRKVDVGHVVCEQDQFHFLNIIGLGLAVDAGLTAKKLKFLGNAAYTLGTLWRVLRLGHYPLVMDLDGDRLEQENVFVTISNSSFTGTRFLMAPDARIDDGFLDVTLLRSLSRTRLLRLFPTIYQGRHVQFEEVETRQVRQLRIQSPVGMLMQPDGEFRGCTPVEIKCLHRDLELFC